MNIDRETFLSVAGRLKAQYQRDKAATTVYDDSDVWIAAIQLLAEAVGDEDAAYINHWIYDSEFGTYPDEELPARTDEEFWDFLRQNL